MNKNEIAAKILNTLGTKKFDEWYNGKLVDYLGGTYPSEDPRQPTREQMLEDIIKIFNL
jgi:hypothetical protein